MTSDKYKMIRVDERHHNGDSGLDLPTYRIVAARTIRLIDGTVVQPGDMGGFVDNERCLSHEGSCWIADNARAYGRTRVRDDALAKDNAVLGDPLSTLRGANLSGKSMVSQFATVADSSIEDEARVDGHSQVLAGSLVNKRSHVTAFASMSFSTASDDSHVGGRAKLLNTSVWDRAFVMGEADLNNCELRDRATVKDFVRAKNVDIVEDSFLQGFVSAIAPTGNPERRGGQTVRGSFTGTADALEQDGAPRLHSEGMTLVVSPDDLPLVVENVLAASATTFHEGALSLRPPAPDDGLNAASLDEARSQGAKTRECGAETLSGTPCSHSVGPDTQVCSAGHKVSGRWA